MGSRWRLNYTLAQLLLVVVMVANVCGVVVAVRADMRPHVEIVEARFSADGRTLMAVLDDNRRVTCDAATGKVVDSAPIDWPPTIGSVDSEGGTRRYPRGGLQHLGRSVPGRPRRVRPHSARQAMDGRGPVGSHAGGARPSGWPDPAPGCDLRQRRDFRPRIHRFPRPRATPRGYLGRGFRAAPAHRNGTGRCMAHLPGS